MAVAVVPLFQPSILSFLVVAMDEPARGAAVDDYLRAAGATVVRSSAALWAAARLTTRREL